MSSPRIVGTANDENAVSRVGVEAVDRLQQAERGDLDEVVELLAAALVAPRELARERQEALDERLARRRVAVAVVALEQPPVLARARGRSVIGRADMLRLRLSLPDRSRSSPRPVSTIADTRRAGALGRGKCCDGSSGPQRSL